MFRAIPICSRFIIFLFHYFLSPIFSNSLDAYILQHFSHFTTFFLKLYIHLNLIYFLTYYKFYIIS